jgi:MFS family permease
VQQTELLHVGGGQTTCTPPPSRARLRAVITRPANLLSLSLAVGAFGTLVAGLFVQLVWGRHGWPYGTDPLPPWWMSSGVLLVSAAGGFALAFAVFPFSRGRARRAGWVAALIAYVGHAGAMAWYSSTKGHGSVIGLFFVLMALLVVIGWVPIVAGLIAGWGVERWQRLPPPEMPTVRDGSIAAAAFRFGVVGMLLSLPMLFAVYTAARRSRVDFAVFFPTAPFVILGLATFAFWLFHSLLPPMRPSTRGGIAGILAAAFTFVAFLFWLRFAVNLYSQNGTPYSSPASPFITAFSLVGWVPLVFGALAGAWTTRPVKTEGPLA